MEGNEFRSLSINEKYRKDNCDTQQINYIQLNHKHKKEKKAAELV